jgi:6-phosphogluconolactonase
MAKRSPGFFLCFLIVGSCMTFWGCGSSSRSCGLACGTPPQYTPFLYATTTSNQILGFSVASTGALTPIASSAGPANSQSTAGVYGALLFADSSSNQVVVESITMQTGALTPTPGSPFTLGSAGGPNSITVGPSGQNLYATETNGTIVGYNAPDPGPTTITALPGSPYAAGIAPTQMAFAGNPGALYASDSGDPNGGILAFAIASNGSLSPIAGSPFATAPNAGPSYLLSTANSTGNQFLFVSLSNASQIAGFNIDTTTGALTPIPGSPFTSGKGPGILINGPTANELLVINTGDHTVEAFNIAANGMLTPIGSPVAVGTASSGMVFGPEQTQSNSQLYTADTAASSIEIVNVDNSSGAISAGGTVSVSSPPLQLAIYDQFPLP